MKFATIMLLAAPVMAAEPKTSTWNFSDPNKNRTIESTSYEDVDTSSKIKEMRYTWSKYFYYAFEAKNVTDEVAAAECSTGNDCDNSGAATQCCVSAAMHHEASNTQDIVYRCMTKSVTHKDRDFRMSLGDFTVNMQCIGSGASFLAMGASAALVAQSMF